MIVMPILPTEICPYTGSDKTSYKHQVSRIADVVKSVYIICHFITSPFTYDYGIFYKLISKFSKTIQKKPR